MGDELKILIRGGNLINKGAEAMLLTVVNQLRKKISNIAFYVFPLDIERGMYSGLGINEIKYSCSRKNIIQYFILNIFKTFPLYCKYQKISTVNQISICCKFNGVIDISGFNYGDYWGVSGFLHVNIWLSEFNKSKNKFYIFMPQAFGPFENIKFRLLFENFFKLSTLICARDQKSMRYLKSNCSNSSQPSNMKLYPDIVFSFREPAVDIGKIGNKVVIGYAPNVHIKKMLQSRTGKDCYSELVNRDLTGITNNIPNCEIRLISTETYPNHENFDDSDICREIFNRCTIPNVTFSDKYLDSYSVYKEIGKCTLLVGSRYHSIIFALSQNIPVVAIGWSHKYEELMGNYDLKDYVVAPESLGNKATIDVIRKVLNNEGSLVKKIKKINRDMRSANDDLFNKIALIIGA